MAYNGKTNWQLNEIVKPEDMNRIEQGIIDANKSLLIHNASADAHKNQFDEFVKGVTGSNATLTITKGNGTTSTVTVNNVANATNATNATKATQDSTGQQINSTYIKGLSVSGKTITYTKGNNTTGTITTQDTVYTHPNSGVSAGTYRSVTVNAQGHVTGGSNPTTLSGYGITDAPTKTGGGASGTWGINITGNAASANKLASESGSNYLEIDTTKDSWDVLGSNPGAWLKSVRTNVNAPPYSLGDYSAAIAFGGGDTKGIITHAYIAPIVKFAGGNGSTAIWKFAIIGGHNDETYNLNDFPTKTGGGASGTWGINISGNANNATKWNGMINDLTTENNTDTWIPVLKDNKLQHTTKANMTVGNATKATHDSAGQQINTTYIKGLSISNNALIYTKGNGTTGNVDLIPAGTVQMFAGNTIPAGWLLCDGSAVSRTDYAKLFSAIGTTWGAGDGSTTFNLPNSIGRFAEGAATSGSYHEAGLPNITGQTLAFAGFDNGAFRTGNLYSYSAPGATNAHTMTVNTFNASRVSSVYGASTTVQPKSFTVRYIIKY